MNKKTLHGTAGNNSSAIRAIVGLGNPGKRYEYTRHNAGFLVLDALAKKYDSSWQENNLMHYATFNCDGNEILLIKPQTFMNDSGKVIPFLRKKGIQTDAILVVHDELELPFGAHKVRFGGSAKGHNGLRSIIDAVGKDFWRLSVGISRPADRQQVPEYVLSEFDQTRDAVLEAIESAADILVHQISQ